MLDHFSWLAPIYERVIPPPDPANLQNLLQLPAAGWLLDAGGGTGRVSQALRPFVDHLVVADFNPQMLQQAAQKSTLALTQNQAERLPFAANYFDRILVVDALHHFHHQAAALADLYRVLKPGGILVIEEPDIQHFSVKLVAWAEKLTLMGSHFHSPAQIQAMLQDLGADSHVVTTGTFAAWVVARKNL